MLKYELSHFTGTGSAGSSGSTGATGATGGTGATGATGTSGSNVGPVGDQGAGTSQGNGLNMLNIGSSSLHRALGTGTTGGMAQSVGHSLVFDHNPDRI